MDGGVADEHRPLVAAGEQAELAAEGHAGQGGEREEGWLSGLGSGLQHGVSG